MTALPDRVLLVRLGAIGDVVNALVVARALRDARPGVRIGWAVHDLARPLVEGHPDVDRVHRCARADGARGLAALVREVRRERYGLAVDLQRIQKSALVARLSGAPRVVGFDRARAKELSWLWTRERVASCDPGAHVVEQYLDVARHLGLGRPSPLHRLPPAPTEARRADALVAELGAAPVVVALGASKPPNRWPPERFGALARSLAAEAAAPVVLVGGPDDRPAAARALAASEDAPGVRDLVGRTSLLELAELLRRARLFVGGDTGPMHLAAAVGLPVVALFGPADPRRTGPWGDGHRVVRAPSGAMARLAVEPVLAAALERLDAPTPTGASPGG